MILEMLVDDIMAPDLLIYQLHVFFSWRSITVASADIPTHPSSRTGYDS
jgi:hypothetical protein